MCSCLFVRYQRCSVDFLACQEELAVEISADSSEANLVLQAIRSVLGCSEKAAIDIFENAVVNRSASADFADELLLSPDAPDAFSKTEYQEIQVHLEKTAASQQHFSEVASAIGAARAKIAKPSSKRKPIDEWIAADVMKLTPANCRVSKDTFNARWILFYGKGFPRWTVSRSWGYAGEDEPCVRFIVREAWHLDVIIQNMLKTNDCSKRINGRNRNCKRNYHAKSKEADVISC